MPISSKTFVRSTVTLLLVALLALLAIVGTVIWLGERSQSYFDAVIEARDARQAASDLRNSLRVAESSQRGFIITGNADYLESFERARDVLPQRLEAIEAALAPYRQADAALDAELASLDGVIADKLAEMQQTVVLAQAGRQDEAVLIVKTDRGKDLMDRAVGFLADVIAASDARLTAGVAEQQASAVWLRWVSIIGGVVIIAVVGGSALAVIAYTRELANARDQIALLNTGLESRVRERTADLARANDEIQRFAYIVTHDLRAPLVNIMGFTSELETSLAPVKALIDRAELDETDPEIDEARIAATQDLPEAIGFIRSSTRKMDGLINAILKLSREGRRVLKIEPVDLNALFGQAADAIRHQVDDAEGAIDIAPGLPTIRSDALALGQVFGNLLDNAVKYRDKQRPLRIAVRAVPAQGGQVAIEVADNGRGIAQQDAERVFELFRRSGAQDQPGEGIGLAFVRTVVRNLGGDIAMRSVLGEGTVFTVTLPRVFKVLHEVES